MVNAVEAFDAKHMKPAEEIPAFRPGDTVDVNVKIQEGNNSRIQTFTGVVIARKGAGVRETFVVRKISFGTGVERRFPVHSPSIDSIKLVRKGRVRRAKLSVVSVLSVVLLLFMSSMVCQWVPLSVISLLMILRPSRS